MATPRSLVVGLGAAVLRYLRSWALFVSCLDVIASACSKAY